MRDEREPIERTLRAAAAARRHARRTRGLGESRAELGATRLLAVRHRDCPAWVLTLVNSLTAQLTVDGATVTEFELYDPEQRTGERGLTVFGTLADGRPYQEAIRMERKERSAAELDAALLRGRRKREIDRGSS
jgi:hypothetical protein